jgi:hypothetical protein
MSSGIAELVRTAPDWARQDGLSTEVRAWLDIVRHGAEIVEALRRVGMTTQKSSVR